MEDPIFGFTHNVEYSEESGTVQFMDEHSRPRYA